MFARRSILAGSLAAGAVGPSNSSASALYSTAEADPHARALYDLIGCQARLGACILDTATGRSVGHRMDERFAMCSTFKLALAAASFLDAQAGRLDLDALIAFTAEDLVVYSPVTQTRVGDKGMRIRELMEAAVMTSDNSAANFLIDALRRTPPAGEVRLRGGLDENGVIVEIADTGYSKRPADQDPV